MGMEEVRLLQIAHILEALILLLEGNVAAIVEAPQCIALRMGALERMGRIDLGSPEVQGHAAQTKTLTIQPQVSRNHQGSTETLRQRMSCEARWVA